MEEFKEFMIKLATRMATGNFTVKVDCSTDTVDKQFAADVIGYSEQYMTVEVRYHLDTLTKPSTKRVSKLFWGFGGQDDDEDYELVETQVPVKTDHINYRYIILD